jgi:hypothetical protein
VVDEQLQHTCATSSDAQQVHIYMRQYLTAQQHNKTIGKKILSHMRRTAAFK